MNTTIYEKELPQVTGSEYATEIVVSRREVSDKYAKEENNNHKCVYYVRIGVNTVFLTSDQMKEFVSDLNSFFGAGGVSMTTKKLSIHSEITLDDLVEEICILDDKSIINFIKSIDLQVADYDFTKTLRDYFVKEMKKEEEAKRKMDSDNE
jgi:hypothetical protein